MTRNYALFGRFPQPTIKQRLALASNINPRCFALPRNWEDLNGRQATRKPLLSVLKTHMLLAYNLDLCCPLSQRGYPLCYPLTLLIRPIISCRCAISLAPKKAFNSSDNWVTISHWFPNQSTYSTCNFTCPKKDITRCFSLSAGVKMGDYCFVLFCFVLRYRAPETL